MNIVIGSDHAGRALKDEIIQHLQQQGFRCDDLGVFSDESMDYPDIAVAVAHKVASGGEAQRGILICGTGLGVNIAANKVCGIRAALCGDTFSAKMASEHNNANILCLGARVTGVGLAFEIVDAFFAAKFAGGRHAERVQKIMQIETE